MRNVYRFFKNILEFQKVNSSNLFHEFHFFVKFEQKIITTLKMRMNFKIACYYSNFHQLKTYSLFFRNIANLNKEKEKIDLPFSLLCSTILVITQSGVAAEKHTKNRCKKALLKTRKRTQKKVGNKKRNMEEKLHE